MSDDAPMPYGLPEPLPVEDAKSGDVGFTDTQQALRLIKALRLQRAGYTNQQIADTLGYKSAGSVGALVREGVKKYASADTEDYKIFFLDKMMNQLETIQEIIDRPGYLHDVKGDLIIGPGGLFLQDKDTQIKAITEWRHSVESVRRMLGVDAPAQKYVTVAQERRVEVINRIKAEIEQIAEEGIEEGDVFDITTDE